MAQSPEQWSQRHQYCAFTIARSLARSPRQRLWGSVLSACETLAAVLSIKGIKSDGVESSRIRQQNKSYGSCTTMSSTANRAARGQSLVAFCWETWTCFVFLLGSYRLFCNTVIFNSVSRIYRVFFLFLFFVFIFMWGFLFDISISNVQVASLLSGQQFMSLSVMLSS